MAIPKAMPKNGADARRASTNVLAYATRSPRKDAPRGTDSTRHFITVKGQDKRDLRSLMGVAHDLIRALDGAFVPLVLSSNRGVPLGTNHEGTSQKGKERHNGIRLHEVPKMREENPRS